MADKGSSAATVDLLDTAAADLKGQSHEFRDSESTPEVVAAALNRVTPTQVQYRLLDVDNSGGTSKQLVLTTPKTWGAGTSFQGGADVTLARSTAVTQWAHEVN